MGLGDDLVKLLPLETAGSRAANRFDYQTEWALCQILQLYATGKNFVLVLDFHDDVLVLDSDSDPKLLHCYQIKTKNSGNWNLKNLIERGKGKKATLPSILGKLYGHRISFGTAVDRLFFVSNAPFKEVRAAGGTTELHDSFVFDDLHQSVLGGAASSLQVEHALSVPADMGIFSYQRCTLPLDSHSDTACGILSRFLDGDAMTKGIPPLAFYRTLKSELSALTQRERLAGTFVELCRAKAITRARFAELLLVARAEQPLPNTVTSILQRLDSENVPFADTASLKADLHRVFFHALDPTNLLIQKDLAEVVEAVSAVTLGDSLWETVERARSSPLLVQVAGRNSTGTVRAMIALSIYEKSQFAPSASGSQDKGT